LPVVPCVSDMGKVLLITSTVDLGDGGWSKPPWDLPQGVIFHSTGLFTHIHAFGLGPVAHLLRNDLLGPWLSTRAHVHPPACNLLR